MPIEIKELEIKATIVTNRPSTDAPDSDRKTIIQECIDQVLLILKGKDER